MNPMYITYNLRIKPETPNAAIITEKDSVRDYEQEKKKREKMRLWG